ncbi:hypothetical protein BGW38_002944 [Lunasporangiospora selenospora]|uniref:Uncharacterized protein n=1 Tax=Lunasporangiospora selenospora TaxID=979761 RepID=A0A9P6KCJ5_9FUNG|nr:hypothetical protein BGW38_002944 [Lunasporangiospora selenospora]
MSTFSFLRAAEHKDDALASMIEEDGEDDVDDVDNEHQEELYEVDDQVQEYRPAIYRHRPIPLASPSHVDEYEDEYEDYVLSNPHLRKSEDAPRTPTRSRVSEARDSYELEDAPRTLTRAGSQLVSPTRTALPSSNPPTLRRTIAAFSPPPRFQGLRSDDSGGYGDHGSHVLEHERGLFEAPNNPMWRPQDSTSELAVINPSFIGNRIGPSHVAILQSHAGQRPGLLTAVKVEV